MPMGVKRHIHHAITQAGSRLLGEPDPLFADNPPMSHQDAAVNLSTGAIEGIGFFPLEGAGKDMGTNHFTACCLACSDRA